MAHIATSTPAAHGFWTAIADAFTAVGHAFARIPEGNEKMRQLEALNALTDAELAERGLRREDIVFHVFSGQMY